MQTTSEEPALSFLNPEYENIQGDIIRDLDIAIKENNKKSYLNTVSSVKKVTVLYKDEEANVVQQKIISLHNKAITLLPKQSWQRVKRLFHR